MNRKTKIIATIGPSSQSELMMKKLIKAGVNVFRLNFSHSSPEQIKTHINRIHKLRDSMKMPLAIMVDTRGPEVRVKSFENGSVNLVKGQIFTLTDKDIAGTSEQVAITQSVVIQNAKVGGIVLANDGLLKMKIVDKKPNQLVCKMLVGGVLKSNKSLSFSNQYFAFDALNEKDKADLQLALTMGVEYIAASFVNKLGDVEALKKFAYQFDSNIKIIAKIENYEGIKNMEQIVCACDGLMVARGDLGVETQFDKLPIIQQQLVDMANKHKKISIVATEMLESMITAIRPTRAEISDVAKAVFDGAKAVMLSGETAVGHDPENVVKTMSKIIRSAEEEFHYFEKFTKLIKNPKNVNDIVIQSAVNASYYLGIKAIVNFTSQGSNARKLCNTFCKVPIVSVTESKKTYHGLSMLSNCIPVMANKSQDIFSQAKQICKELGLAKQGDLIAVTTGTTDKMANVLKFEEI